MHCITSLFPLLFVANASPEVGRALPAPLVSLSRPLAARALVRAPAPLPRLTGRHRSGSKRNTPPQRQGPGAASRPARFPRLRLAARRFMDDERRLVTLGYKVLAPVVCGTAEATLSGALSVLHAAVRLQQLARRSEGRKLKTGRRAIPWAPGNTVPNSRGTVLPVAAACRIAIAQGRPCKPRTPLHMPTAHNTPEAAPLQGCCWSAAPSCTQTGSRAATPPPRAASCTSSVWASAAPTAPWSCTAREDASTAATRSRRTQVGGELGGMLNGAALLWLLCRGPLLDASAATHACLCSRKEWLAGWGAAISAEVCRGVVPAEISSPHCRPFALPWPAGRSYRKKWRETIRVLPQNISLKAWLSSVGRGARPCAWRPGACWAACALLAPLGPRQELCLKLHAATSFSTLACVWAGRHSTFSACLPTTQPILNTKACLCSACSARPCRGGSP